MPFLYISEEKYAVKTYRNVGMVRKGNMRPDDFHAIDVPAGKYRLVPDEKLSELIARLEILDLLGIPPRGEIDLPFLVSYFRAIKDLSINRLGEEADIDRRQLKALEEGANPDVQGKTIEKLCVYFGGTFRRAMKILTGREGDDSRS